MISKVETIAQVIQFQITAIIFIETEESKKKVNQKNIFPIMQSKLYHPPWRILFIVGFVAINSSYVFKLLSIEVPQFWTVAKYVIGYSVVGFGIIQVLFSSIIRNGEKVMWCISLLLLAPLALLLYVIVYKRIHGFYIHHSKI